MARLILKAPYYKPLSRVPSGVSRGGYANYIATREGVEVLPRGGMVGYIGERRGSNGLFSDDGKDIVLSQIAKEMDEHQGNIWGLIFSLTREDAERLGYNSASQWVSLLRSHRNDIAREMHIAPKNLCWYAAYHNAEGHPHVHVLVWSKDPQEPYLSTVGIHNLKQVMAADIFRQDNISHYKKQTEARDDLKAQFRVKIAEIAKEIERGGVDISCELLEKFTELSSALEKHKGKKVYGYLGKNTKTVVDDIVKIIAEDEKINALYDLWYRLQCEIFRTYTDRMPEKIPLHENKEFKSLRNFVVSTAAELLPDMPLDRSLDADHHLRNEQEENEFVLRYGAENGDPYAMYRYTRLFLENDDPDEAEYWLQKAAEKENPYAAYLLYRCYRDGRIDDKNGEKMKYLLMAVDKEFGYAEYEYAKFLDGKNDEIALEYLRQAAKHGCVQAEYAIGKRFIDKGQIEEGLEYLEKAASTNDRARFYLGLLYYYKLDDRERGMEHLITAADNGFIPAQNAISHIQNGLNARIITGICNLFYYASRILDERAEAQYPYPDYDGVDIRTKQEDRAKRMGIAMAGF